MNISFFCNPQTVEQNALVQVENYASKAHLNALAAFPDIHFCEEKALPVGVAFRTTQYFYPLITGKDIGCGVMYLKVNKSLLLKPFAKSEHYAAWARLHHSMTDDGLGGGNHFLSLEEDEDFLYIICHTGTRNLGIGFFHRNYQLVQDFSAAYGQKVEFLSPEFVGETYFQDYEKLLEYGYARRKAFCLKTLIFLQKAGYIQSHKAKIPDTYLRDSYANYAESDQIFGAEYELADSIHNHLRFLGKDVIHRKGSTELVANKIAVIPLSMSRGSLLVKPLPTLSVEEALSSCSHGAGRALSRFQAMRHWSNGLKEKERRNYKQQFSELLNAKGEFLAGYIQEMDFAYKDSSELLHWQPWLKKVSQTTPIATIKYSEI